jgi:hypothetical protein
MPDRFDRILSDPPPAAGDRAHLLAQRAERLARLGRRRPGAGPTGADNPEAALESFIAALAGAVAPAPERAPRAEILPFARGAEKAPGRLPGRRRPDPASTGCPVRDRASPPH